MTEVNYNDYSMETREKRQIYYSKSYFKKRKKKEIFIPNEKEVSLEYNSEREIIAIQTLKHISENWDDYWSYQTRPTCGCETCDLHKRSYYFYLPKNLMRPC